MITVVIGDRASRAEKDGVVVASFENNGVDTSKIAQADYRGWLASRMALGGATSTDLTTASITDPDLADLLWGPFLSYLYYSARPSHWQRILFLVAGRVIRLPARIDISDDAIRSAVQDSIARSQYFPRFRVDKK